MVDVLSVNYHLVLRQSSVVVLRGNIKNTRVNENKLVERVHLVIGGKVVCKLEKVQIYYTRDVNCVV